MTLHYFDLVKAGLEKSVAAAKPCHHAFMYGHRALQRRINVLSTLADKNKVCVRFVVRFIETKFGVNTF